MLGERMTSDLVLAALNRALLTMKPESVIPHSDRGSRYTSVAFDKLWEVGGAAPPWEAWETPVTTPWPRVSLSARCSMKSTTVTGESIPGRAMPVHAANLDPAQTPTSDRPLSCAALAFGLAYWPAASIFPS